LTPSGAGRRRPLTAADQLPLPEFFRLGRTFFQKAAVSSRLGRGGFFRE
jgi:hypothetical protein